ncbi:MAG: hypothetical protein II742_02390 [Clostridia bacterium]|nr:hypothetical protein [Clostridia bacterium]
MTLGFAIKVILEVLVVMLIAYGIWNEEKLVAFEEELFPVLKFCFNKYILKKNVRTKKTPVRRKAAIKVISGRKHENDSVSSVA